MKSIYSLFHRAPRMQLENSTEASYRAFNTQQVNLNTKLVRALQGRSWVAPHAQRFKVLLFDGQFLPSPQGCKPKVLERELLFAQEA